MTERDVLHSLMGPPNPEGRFYGVTVGIVTNNQDPDGLGRVKVHFPWLSDQDESYWARIATPMAGSMRGLYLLPEVNDEVLVAFEHGDVHFPYILGALWNGQDRPPETNSDGSNNRRTLRSRSGHIIRLDDTIGSEKIEIIDRSAQNSIVISTSDNAITITANANITIQAGLGKLILQGNGVDIVSLSEITLRANQNVDLQAGLLLNIQGLIVNIN